MSAGARAAERFTVRRPLTRSITEGTSPFLTRLSPRQITSEPGARISAAGSAVDPAQADRVGEVEPVSQYRAISIATINPIMPTTPRGVPFSAASEPSRQKLTRFPTPERGCFACRHLIIRRAGRAD